MRQARCSLRVVVPLGQAHRKSKKNSRSKTAFVLGMHLVSIGLAPMGPTTAKLRQQGRSSELSFRLARMEAATPSPLRRTGLKTKRAPRAIPSRIGRLGRQLRKAVLPHCERTNRDRYNTKSSEPAPLLSTVANTKTLQQPKAHRASLTGSATPYTSCTV